MPLALICPAAQQMPLSLICPAAQQIPLALICPCAQQMPLVSLVPLGHDPQAPLINTILGSLHTQFPFKSRVASSGHSHVLTVITHVVMQEFKLLMFGQGGHDVDVTLEAPNVIEQPVPLTKTKPPNEVISYTQIVSPLEFSICKAPFINAIPTPSPAGSELPTPEVFPIRLIGSLQLLVSEIDIPGLLTIAFPFFIFKRKIILLFII